ncbi:MAG: hypothetical protein Q6K14_08545, partial [Gloeomargarita sp. GMQP_bins_44]
PPPCGISIVMGVKAWSWRFPQTIGNKVRLSTRAGQGTHQHNFPGAKSGEWTGRSAYPPAVSPPTPHHTARGPSGALRTTSPPSATHAY